MKHSSSPGAMYCPSESQQKSNANVCRSKSDVSTRKNALSEYMFGQPSYKRTESSPEVVCCIVLFIFNITNSYHAHIGSWMCLNMWLPSPLFLSSDCLSVYQWCAFELNSCVLTVYSFVSTLWWMMWLSQFHWMSEY